MAIKKEELEKHSERRRELEEALGHEDVFDIIWSHVPTLKFEAAFGVHDSVVPARGPVAPAHVLCNERNGLEKLLTEATAAQNELKGHVAVLSSRVATLDGVKARLGKTLSAQEAKMSQLLDRKRELSAKFDAVNSCAASLDRLSARANKLEAKAAKFGAEVDDAKQRLEDCTRLLVEYRDSIERTVKRAGECQENEWLKMTPQQQLEALNELSVTLTSVSECISKILVAETSKVVASFSTGRIKSDSEVSRSQS